MIKTGNRGGDRFAPVHHNTDTTTRDGVLKNNEMMPDFIATNGMYKEAKPVSKPKAKVKKKGK